ncbi:hypothetical protein FRC12_020334 [Ceratobasidium sp. 428]|nr:hypothetical protein FRC12_020334 [Ceratobasidium sp. 428]
MIIPKKSSHDVINSVREYILQAIKSGDTLPNTKSSLDARVQRHALIIAPQYQAHLPGYDHLPGTLTDVYNVHRMLRQCGYNKANIRVLVDGSQGEPTKENVVRIFSVLFLSLAAQSLTVSSRA